jgi:ABC-type sugar transport system ATPase subunit
MTTLVLEKLTKAYGKQETIRGVDLQIASGEFIVLVGPSGCGKSTLLRMIAGLESVTSGTIRIDEEDVTDVAPSRRGAAMVFQSYALYPHMNVLKNLSFGLKNMKCSAAHINAQVVKAAEILQLGDLLQRMPHQLSGGQRQRVAIGRAIVRRPRIFLFDEPLSNLDTELRVQMRQELAKLHRQLSGTMVYVTHDQTEAMTLADRIVVLNGGRVAQVGTPLELYNRPANIFTASFIGSPKINLFPANVVEADDRLIAQIAGGTRIPLGVRSAHLKPGDAVTLGIRPEHVTPRRGTDGIACEFVLDAVEALGDTTSLYASLGSQQLRVKLEGQHGFTPGEPLTLFIDPAKVLVFSATGEAINADDR